MSQSSAISPRLLPVRARQAPPTAAVPPAPVTGAPPATPVVTIGSTPVHLIDEQGARRLILDGATRPGVLGVCSVNLDHIHHFASSPRGFATDVSADDPVRWLNLIDGAPIARQARRMTGVRYPRLAGSDLIGGVLDDLEAAGLSVAVLGGPDDASAALRDRLSSSWPGLSFAGHWAPPRAALEDPSRSRALAAEIRAAHADVLIVCLGKPRQENWIDRYGAQTGAHVLLAFGAVVDFLAGRVSRAPGWISAAGLEWLWRLMLEPRRLARRYLIEGPPAYLRVRRSGLAS